MTIKMKKEFTLKIEESKSWFVLAQITIILSGFMFATSGIYFNNLSQTQKMLQDTFFEALNSEKFTLQENDSYSSMIENIMDNLGNLEERYNYKSGFYLKIGLTLTLISGLLWFIGHSGLKTNSSSN